eukprot:TRINITY_DN33661_c0_g1_i1.p1 TRINITY_DN33661_c0_g1~~TRINITY_DN33661_c0_g1_i1.p1  ORF type:complete len:507 (-),score=86.56 TRINITY_DN33661_c0_g1_i1:14-1534(-)
MLLQLSLLSPRPCPASWAITSRVPAFDQHSRVGGRFAWASNTGGRGFGRRALASTSDLARRGSPYQEGELVELRVESLTSTGQGLGRLGPTRWVIMAFGVLPGELARLQIIRNFRGRSEAKLEQLLEASPDRVEPRCPIFDRCSGCQYQHLHYDAQLRWKRRHVQDAFSRIGGLNLPVDFVRPVVPSPLQYHYRTKITPHPQEPPPARQRVALEQAGVSLQEADEAAIGFLEEDWGSVRDATGRRWRRVVDAPTCIIATEAINACLPAARAEARLAKEIVRPLLLRHSTVDSVVTDGHATVTEELPGLGAFSFRAGGFFQNNSSILPSFVKHVVSAAQMAGIEFLLDVYCGVGLFAISAAKKHFRYVLGVEVDDAAVTFARYNAKNHGLRNVEFLAADASRGIEQLRARLPSERTAVVVDPPRQGLSQEARVALLSLRPRRLVYVSCDCATQARDLRDFVSAGYKLQGATPFDLFPQTRHLEVVVVLDLCSDSESMVSDLDRASRL